MGLNRDLIGKQYPTQTYAVSADPIAAYARAYSEDNPRFFGTGQSGSETLDPASLVAPPMFGVVAGWPSLLTVIGDVELNVDLLRLLHTHQDMYFFKAIRPGDTIRSTAEIVAIDAQRGGESLTVRVAAENQTGHAVQTMLFTAFVRGRTRAARAVRRTVPKLAGEPLFVVPQTIDHDQPSRYAEASGDHNPIHTDENVARLAGLPGIVVHGLCTLAFVSKVVLDHLCGGDPARLRRLAGEFARPVFPGQTISTRMRPGEAAGRYCFETWNPAGRVVIQAGRAEVATIV